MILSEAFELYVQKKILNKGQALKTVRNYRSALSSLLKSLGDADIPIGLLTLRDIENWEQYRSRMGNKSSTIAHDLSRLKQVLTYLLCELRMDVLEPRLITRSKVVYSKRVFLTPSEVQQILDVIDSPRDKALFACMYDCGCRISELLGLNRGEIVDKRANIIGKGDIEGELYFNDWSLRYLNEYLKTRRDTVRPLFISSQMRRITVSRVEQLLHIYTDKAAINKNVTPHTLRHSFASDLKRNGADIFDIQKQLRHQRIASTQIYVHIDDDQRRQTYESKHTKLR